MSFHKLSLETPIHNVPLIGPSYERRLKKLGIETVKNLLEHYPFRYEDYTLIVPIEYVQPGEIITITGVVQSIRNAVTRNGLRIQKARVTDETGKIDVVWFNQPYLLKTLRPGTCLSLSGHVDWFGNSIVMKSPEFELVKKTYDNTKQHIPQTIHTGRLVPIYQTTRGVSSKWLRSRISLLLDLTQSSLKDYLPTAIREKLQLIPYIEALKNIHFPENKTILDKAKHRLAFNELFIIQLSSILTRREWDKDVVTRPFSINKHKKEINSFMKDLPFELTSAQKHAVKDILHDLKEGKPMNRLLEGDVGSGKTVVSAIGMFTAALNGFQSVLMAPTEILAQQHYETVDRLLRPRGISVSLRTGSMKTGDINADIVVGTHALLTDAVILKRLAFVVIDEQQRFGVEQRAKLREKGINPHLLTMTATPIPRTVALTLYGELSLSYLDELPQGRKHTKTWVVPPEKRIRAYQWIKKKVKDTKEQAFIICPLIEESESMESVKAATKEFERLQKGQFSDLTLGLLHGRMNSKEKDKSLSAFRDGKYDVLVSTPVVEVGIDIPTATIMMIEAAERFGLAQLHQLRGRVGRGDHQAYCLLFTESDNTTVIKRLKHLEKTSVGLELAELDLRIRGPGERYGTKQHGQLNLKIASLSDTKTIEQSRNLAQKILNHDPSLSHFPLLLKRIKAYKIKHIAPD